MNFEKVYETAVAKAKDGDLFIELGTFLGRSAAFMAEQIKLSGKKIDFITIDLFEPSGGDPVPPDAMDKACANLKECGVLDIVTVVKGRTVDLAALIKEKFNDRKIDFIFIDAGHTYNDVKKDIETFLPLVKEGGTMAGHDYNLAGVKQAVDEKFSAFQLEFHLNSWIYNKPVPSI
jgi:predicted O-methyltransferase YrrM